MAAVAVQIDEVVFLTNNPHTVQLGAAKGLIGQYKRKTVRELTHEHREAIASGYSAIDLKGGEVELGGEESCAGRRLAGLKPCLEVWHSTVPKQPPNLLTGSPAVHNVANLVIGWTS